MSQSSDPLSSLLPSMSSSSSISSSSSNTLTNSDDHEILCATVIHDIKRIACHVDLELRRHALFSLSHIYLSFEGDPPVMKRETLQRRKTCASLARTTLRQLDYSKIRNYINTNCEKLMMQDMIGVSDCWTSTMGSIEGEIQMVLIVKEIENSVIVLHTVDTDIYSLAYGLDGINNNQVVVFNNYARKELSLIPWRVSCMNGCPPLWLWTVLSSFKNDYCPSGIFTTSAFKSFEDLFQSMPDDYCNGNNDDEVEGLPSPQRLATAVRNVYCKIYKSRYDKFKTLGKKKSVDTLRNIFDRIYWYVVLQHSLHSYIHTLRPEYCELFRFVYSLGLDESCTKTNRSVISNTIFDQDSFESTLLGLDTRIYVKYLQLDKRSGEKNAINSVAL
jgi:hypothetical protein